MKNIEERENRGFLLINFIMFANNKRWPFIGLNAMKETFLLAESTCQNCTVQWAQCLPQDEMRMAEVSAAGLMSLSGLTNLNPSFLIISSFFVNFVTYLFFYFTINGFLTHNSQSNEDTSRNWGHNFFNTMRDGYPNWQCISNRETTLEQTTDRGTQLSRM